MRWLFCYGALTGIHSFKANVLLTEDFAVNHCLSNYFSSGICIVGFFRTAIIISNEVLQLIIFSTVLKIFLMLDLQPFTLASALSFSVLQNTSYRETKFVLKQLHFLGDIGYIQIRAATPLKQLLSRKNNFFRTSSCLVQSLPSKNYFLIKHTFSDQLLSSCFGRATPLE